MATMQLQDILFSQGFGTRRVCAGLVQQGLDPTDWKPMPTVALGVREIRIHTRVESRVLYVAKFADAIYVLHAFVKKTEKTDPRDINIAKSRMAALIEERRMEGNAK